MSEELDKQRDGLWRILCRYPRSAPAIQQAQNFLEAMVEIQTLPAPTIGELGTVSEAIMAMAKGQEHDAN